MGKRNFRRNRWREVSETHPSILAAVCEDLDANLIDFDEDDIEIEILEVEPEDLDWWSKKTCTKQFGLTIPFSRPLTVLKDMLILKQLLKEL